MSNDPYLSTARLSLLDRGFVYAIAHVRGGGEMGRKWYENGKYLRKKNTFTDFIACAEHLIEQGFTSPPKLCIEVSPPKNCGLLQVVLLSVCCIHELLCCHQSVTSAIVCQDLCHGYFVPLLYVLHCIKSYWSTASKCARHAVWQVDVLLAGEKCWRFNHGCSSQYEA